MPDGKPSRRPLVWIVDDSPTERQISERALGGRYELVHIGDGSVAVERLAAADPLPDLILLDWVMPGMTGDEVCRFIRSHDATRAVPVILVTASRVETDDIVLGLNAGANDYVARPFAPEELRARVEAALRAKQLTDASRRERTRLDTINRLGHALFGAGSDVERILDELARALTAALCDGCSIMLLPGDYPQLAVARHRGDPSGAALAAIASLADPVVHGFADDAAARAGLPPAYHDYIARFGLRGLAIMPFPALGVIQGVVTATRDGDREAFSDDDIATIATCVEYASLAAQNALRFVKERLARAQLDVVFARAPFGIVVTDEHGVIALANAAATRMVPGIAQAATADAIYQLATWRTTDGEPLAQPAWLARWRCPPGPGAADLVVEPPEGERRTLSVATVALVHDGTAGTVTTLEDVSEARAITAERERVARFQQQMLGIVSHDLRNPLGAIVAGLDVIETRTTDTPAVAPVLKRMRASTGRMVAIIDQLLDVTRARLGGGIPLTRRTTSLRQIARGVVDELRLARGRAIELTGDDEVKGYWDPDRLAQVVSNLVGNAVQYGDPERPIVVDVRGTDTAAILTVRNAVLGAPIPADRLQRIFDPYARAGESDRHAGGLGLGLYIVSEILRSHQGTIVATSTPEATTFRAVLPRRFDD